MTNSANAATHQFVCTCGRHVVTVAGSESATTSTCVTCRGRAIRNLPLLNRPATRTPLAS